MFKLGSQKKAMVPCALDPMPLSIPVSLIHQIMVSIKYNHYYSGNDFTHIMVLLSEHCGVLQLSH